MSSPDEVSRIGGGGAPSANERGAGATTRPPLVRRSWSLGGMGHRAVEAPVPARRHRRWTRGGDARCEDADVLAAEADATLAQRPTVDHDVAMLRRVTTSDRGEESGLSAQTGCHFRLHAGPYSHESSPHVLPAAFSTRLRPNASPLSQARVFRSLVKAVQDEVSVDTRGAHPALPEPSRRSRRPGTRLGRLDRRRDFFPLGLRFFRRARNARRNSAARRGCDANPKAVVPVMASPTHLKGKSLTPRLPSHPSSTQQQAPLRHHPRRHLLRPREGQGQAP